MNIEDLVRAAQERQAERAAPADRIRAALPSRAARAHRRRRFGALTVGVAAAAVAAAVTVPALALREQPGGAVEQVIAGGTPSAAPTPAATPAPEVALGYRPTWVPAGFAEHIRAVRRNEPQEGPGVWLTRSWKRQVSAGDPFKGAELTLYVTSATKVPDDGGRRVDINGRTGYYTGSRDGDQKSGVNWAVDADTVLMLTTNKVELSEKDLLKMARSVRPDPGRQASPVQLGWLPPGWAPTGFVVSGPTPATWRGEVHAGRQGPPSAGVTTKDKQPASGGQLSVAVGSIVDSWIPAGGKQLTVGGRPARQALNPQAPPGDLGFLIVDLGGGRWLTMYGSGPEATLETMVKVAENIQVAPDAGVEWLGKR